jgi:hypothetical protein
LSLISAPEIKSLADLRGTTLSVDAMTTGYAFTLRRMLEKAGLKDGDYTLTSVGGMKERYEALLERKQAGSLLVPPFTLAALDRQFNELTTALALLGHFQGGVAVARGRQSIVTSSSASFAATWQRSIGSTMPTARAKRCRYSRRICRGRRPRSPTSRTVCCCIQAAAFRARRKSTSKA